MQLLHQTTFENLMTKGEIIHDEQFHSLTQFVQLYWNILLTFIEIFNIFASIFQGRLLEMFAVLYSVGSDYPVWSISSKFSELS